MNFRQMERWVSPLKRRVLGMIAKAVIKAVDDSKEIQVVKISLNGETHSEVERLQPYGFTSRPIAGAQALVVFVGGNRDNPLVIACDDGRHRVKLANGEVAVYNDGGAVVKLKADSTVELGDGTPLAPTAGVVTGECINPSTGTPFPDVSLKIKAKKG